MPDETQPAPDTRSLAWSRQEEAAAIMRDCYEGPLRMRAAGKTYLPKFPREDLDAYNDRLATSVFYDATARTINGLTGMVFRKPPQLAEDLPGEITALWENVDLRGKHGDVFCRERHRDGEIDGHFVIFVDMQRTPGARSKAEERRAGLRPYWVGIRKQDVYGFETVEVSGRPVLSHFRYGETEVVKEGRYGQKEERRVREFNLVTSEGGRPTVQFIVWALRVVEQKEQWTVVDEGTLTGAAGPMDEIPVSVGYLGDQVGTLESRPPHVPLSLENIKHYQLVSDNDNCLHVSAVPIPVFIGVDPDQEIAVGPNMGIKLPVGGSALYLEPEGNGLDAMERRIQKSEQRMAILGLSLLMSEARQAETATSKRIDKAENDSALASHARASQDAFEEAIRLTAKWLGVEAKMPKRDASARWLSLNTEFENLTIDSQTITALSNAVAAGQLTLETMWEMLVRGNLLSSSFDAEKEKEMLDGGAMEPPVTETLSMVA